MPPLMHARGGVWSWSSSLSSSTHLVVVLVVITSSSSWSSTLLAPAIHPTSSCLWQRLGVLWLCHRVLPSPSLLSPPPRCGPLPFVVVPSSCSPFPPHEQLLTVAVGGAVVAGDGGGGGRRPFLLPFVIVPLPLLPLSTPRAVACSGGWGCSGGGGGFPHCPLSLVIVVPCLLSWSSSSSSSCPCHPIPVVPCFSLWSPLSSLSHPCHHGPLSLLCLIAISIRSPPCEQLLAMAGPGAGSWSRGLASFPSHPLFAVVPSQQIYNL